MASDIRFCILELPRILASHERRKRNDIDEIFLKWFIQINSIISNVITIQHERSESTCLVLYVEVRQDGATVANKTKIRFKK
jgi:hypothetical protein